MAIAYKLFRTMKSKPGKLFPLYVLANKETELGVWLPAENGILMENGKVKSKLGGLAYRPGWHLADFPLATHIGKKVNGEIAYMRDDTVWCECEYETTINYQLEANANGTTGDGRVIPKNSMLRHVPEHGYYRYKTNPNMLGEWIIAGNIKVNRVLSDAEVAEICRKRGYEPQRRCA